ncbi:MAG: transposase [Candidatus Symbiodolus clandestinus]
MLADRLSPFFGYPADIRKVIYTTNAIESLNSVLRNAINKRKAFPSDESVKKVLWLAIQRWPLKNRLCQSVTGAWP